MNQPVLSAIAGLSTFGLFALLVRVLPRRWTTPTPPTRTDDTNGGQQ